MYFKVVSHSSPLYYLFNFCRELLGLKVEQFGEDHLDVAKVLNNLAVIYCLKVNVDKRGN